MRESEAVRFGVILVVGTISFLAIKFSVPTARAQNSLNLGDVEPAPRWSKSKDGAGHSTTALRSNSFVIHVEPMNENRKQSLMNEQVRVVATSGAVGSSFSISCGAGYAVAHLPALSLEPFDFKSLAECRNVFKSTPSSKKCRSALLVDPDNRKVSVQSTNCNIASTSSAPTVSDKKSDDAFAEEGLRARQNRIDLKQRLRETAPKTAR